jgi:hypothetical protein
MPKWKPVERVGKLSTKFTEPEAWLEATLSTRTDADWANIYNSMRSDFPLTAESRIHDVGLLTGISVTFKPNDLEAVVAEIDRRVEAVNDKYATMILPAKEAREADEQHRREEAASQLADLQARAAKLAKPEPPPSV